MKLAAAILFLVACNSSSKAPEPSAKIAAAPTTPTAPVTVSVPVQPAVQPPSQPAIAEPTKDMTPYQTLKMFLDAVAAKDLDTVKSLIHPVRGFHRTIAAAAKATSGDADPSEDKLDRTTLTASSLDTLPTEIAPGDCPRGFGTSGIVTCTTRPHGEKIVFVLSRYDGGPYVSSIFEESR
jgi:hypothetical protein